MDVSDQLHAPAAASPPGREPLGPRAVLDGGHYLTISPCSSVAIPEACDKPDQPARYHNLGLHLGLCL